jgi:hypothetical protein
MSRQASCGMSAPPEVVFSTATDPDRRDGWLPRELRLGPIDTGPDTYEVRLSAGPGGSDPAGVLQVRPGDAGGAMVELSVSADGGAAPEEILGNLERMVTDNFNAG